MKTLVLSLLFLATLVAGLSVSAQMPPPPPASPQGPPPQVMQAPGTPAGFYYYCRRAGLYYPAVPVCPEGWIAIPVQQPPPPPPPVMRGWREPPFEYESEDIVKSRPNAVTLEMLGRALLYSVDYDIALNPRLSLGVGVSYWQLEDWWRDYNASVTVVPVYMDYYFSARPQRGYVSAGIDWITVTQSGYDNSVFTNNGVAAVLGGGYEMMDRSGFLMRIGGYLIVGRSVTASPSLSLGYAF